MQNLGIHNKDYALSFQQGEEEGLNWFFNLLYPTLTFYCNKIIGDKEASEEIASHAFMKIWERHERFADADSIKAYLYRIVKNDALKYLRKEKQTTAFNKEVIYLYANEHQKDCFDSLVTTEITHELLLAINALPAACSKVFKLMYLEGKSIKETAEELNLSTSTVKTQKARGLAVLRKMITTFFMVSIPVLFLLR